MACVVMGMVIHKDAHSFQTRSQLSLPPPFREQKAKLSPLSLPELKSPTGYCFFPPSPRPHYCSGGTWLGGVVGEGAPGVLGKGRVAQRFPAGCSSCSTPPAPDGLQQHSASTPTHIPAMRYSFFPPTSRETPQMAEEGAV